MPDPVPTQLNTGNATTSTVTCSFAGQAVGTLLELNTVADFYFQTSGSGRPESSGWTKVREEQYNAGHAKYYKIADGSETSVQYTLQGAGISIWSVIAVTNIDTTTPYDVGTGQSTVSNSTSYTTGSTTPSAGRKIAIGAITAPRFSGAGITAHSSWTNGYTEISDVAATSGSTSESLGVAYLVLDGGVATSTGSTFNGTGIGAGGIIAVYNNGSAAPPALPPILLMPPLRR